METNNIIKKIRKEHNLTQVKFGKILNCDRYRIADIERGKPAPTIEDIRVISQRFKISADYLLCLTDTKTIDKDMRFICDYTGLNEETIKFFVFQRHVDEYIGFYDNTISFIEKLVAKIWSNTLFTMNINTLIDDITILAELYDAQILKRNNNENIIIDTEDENEIKEIMERIISLQQANSEEIENLEDTVNSMKYKLTRFLNEFLEEFSLSNSGFTLKEFEEMENNFYKKGGVDNV